MRLLSSLDPQRDRYSGNRLAQGLFDARHQLQEIRQPIGPRLEHEDGDGERRQVLLKGQVAIDRDEDVELPCRRCQQGTVLEAGPVHLRDGLDRVARQAARQAPIDALIQQHLKRRRQGPSPSLLQGSRSPVRGARWGNLRENR